MSLLPYDDNLKHIQRQKAGTPVRDSMPMVEVAAEFRSMTRPNAAVLEKNSYGSSSGNAQLPQLAESMALVAGGPLQPEPKCVATAWNEGRRTSRGGGTHTPSASNREAMGGTVS